MNKAIEKGIGIIDVEIWVTPIRRLYAIDRWEYSANQPNKGDWPEPRYERYHPAGSLPTVVLFDEPGFRQLIRTTEQAGTPLRIMSTINKVEFESDKWRTHNWIKELS